MNQALDISFTTLTIHVGLLTFIYEIYLSDVWIIHIQLIWWNFILWLFQLIWFIKFKLWDHHQARSGERLLWSTTFKHSSAWRCLRIRVSCQLHTNTACMNLCLCVCTWQVCHTLSVVTVPELSGLSCRSVENKTREEKKKIRKRSEEEWKESWELAGLPTETTFIRVKPTDSWFLWRWHNTVIKWGYSPQKSK